MSKKTKTEIVQLIARVLDRSEGHLVADIANQVLPDKVEYLNNSFFEVSQEHFVEFEYADQEYALVPFCLCVAVGANTAFEQHTGIHHSRIVRYTNDELYDADGCLLEQYAVPLPLNR